MTEQELKALAHQATEALLQQVPVPVYHPPGWQRKGFPLPMKRMLEDKDGGVTQNYRPIALLEYVHDVLSGELKARQQKQRKEDKAKEGEQ